jgi:hypothetical protein
LIPQLNQWSIRLTIVTVVEMIACLRVGVWMHRVMWVNKAARRTGQSWRRGSRNKRRIAMEVIGLPTQ